MFNSLKHLKVRIQQKTMIGIKALWTLKKGNILFISHIKCTYTVNRKWQVQHSCWGQRGGEGCGWDHVCAPMVQVIHGNAGEQTGVWVTPSASSSFFVRTPWCVCASQWVHFMCVSNLSGTDSCRKGRIHTHTAVKPQNLNTCPLNGDFHTGQDVK